VRRWRGQASLSADHLIIGAREDEDGFPQSPGVVHRLNGDMPQLTHCWWLGFSENESHDSDNWFAGHGEVTMGLRIRPEPDPIDRNDYVNVRWLVTT
jgi:hypothetical protein